MPRTERRRAAATSAVFGLLAALALPAAAAPSVGLGALVTDEPDFQPYYATVAARHAARARAGTVEAAAPKSTYVVRVEGPIAGSTTATRAALAGLGPSCEVLGTVAYLQGHYVVECSGSVARRDALAAPGIADVELQVPMQRLFKRKGIPPKNPGYDSLSDEWKEELRGRIEEDDRQREEANAAQGSALEKRSQLEKRTVYTLPQVDAIWAKLGIKDPFVKRQWHIVGRRMLRLQ